MVKRPDALSLTSCEKGRDSLIDATKSTRIGTETSPVPIPRSKRPMMA